MSDPIQVTTPGIAALRRRKKLSQGELAALAGVSQATISRIEKGTHKPDLRLLAKIARALGAELRDVAQDSDVLEVANQPDQFYAFCPNPFCDRNKFERSKEGKPLVYWMSGVKYPMERYDEVNFCARCGTDLAKDCPSCRRVLSDVGTRYCISCGAAISNRPTADEWKRIEALLPKEQKPDDDDIPF